MNTTIDKARREAIIGMPLAKVETMDALGRIIQEWNDKYPTAGTVTHCGVEVQIAALLDMQAEAERLQLPDYKWKPVVQMVFYKIFDCGAIFLWELRDFCDPCGAANPKVYRRFATAIVKFLDGAVKNGTPLFPKCAVFYRGRSGGYYDFDD